MSVEEPININVPPVVRDVLLQASLDGEGSLTQQVYRLLRDLIVELRLLPNQFLSEKDVASALAISKTPVREAFIRLADDGMVAIVPKSGTYVSHVDFDRVHEGYFIWRSLEAACAAEVAEKRTIKDLYFLTENLRRQKEALDAGDNLGFYHNDNEFHDAMFTIAGFPAAKKLIETAKFEVDRIRNLKMLFGLPPVDEVHAEHQAVVDAVSKKDAALAQSRMYKHLSRVNDSLDSLADNPGLWELFHHMSRPEIGRRGPQKAKGEAGAGRRGRR